MPTRTRRIIGGALVTAAVALAGPPTEAVDTVLCTIDAFQMGPQPVDAVNRPNGILVEWHLSGTSTVRCPGQAAIGIDVWEHAVVALPPGGGPVRGRADGFLTFGDHVISWSGPVRGTATCAGGTCQVDLAVLGTAPREARVRLPRTGSLALGPETVTLAVDGADFLIWQR